MSNYLAIAATTATLQQLLQDAVKVDVPGATVSARRPDATTTVTAPTVNLFLYQVASNSAYRNADLPTRNGDGRVVTVPRVAIDLHYLISFYGDDDKLEPQQLLGSVVRTMHAHPVLTSSMIGEMIDANKTSANLGYLVNSDLARAIEQVKFTPLPLTLEELSKLWSVFFQTTYAVSVAYQGTVILIETTDNAAVGLPVRDRSLSVMPFRRPTIEAVLGRGADGSVSPVITAASTIVIQGKQLKSPTTRVGLAGVEAPPSDVSDTQVSVPLTSLPAGALRAGVQGLTIVQDILAGIPPAPHRGFESDVAPFILRPSIGSATVKNVTGTGPNPRSADIVMNVTPTVRAGQRATMMLTLVQPLSTPPPAPVAFSFQLPQIAADSTSITGHADGVPAGAYLVRLQVDGAESPLVVDADPHSATFDQYVGPKVSIA